MMYFDEEEPGGDAMHPDGPVPVDGEEPDGEGTQPNGPASVDGQEPDGDAMQPGPYDPPGEVRKLQPGEYDPELEEEEETRPKKPQVPGGQERFIANPEEAANTPEEASAVAAAAAPKKKGSEYLILLIGVAVLAAVGVGLYMSKQPVQPKSDSADLGEGIYNAAGLRGHLVANWQGQARYQLEIEPIDPRENDGFALVAEDPPGPIYFNIRVLDASGFALCGKQVILPYVPDNAVQAAAPGSERPGSKAERERAARELAERQTKAQQALAQEQQWEQGKDILQGQVGADGRVNMLTTQGVLPCSPAQFKRFDYWDISTNFPTLAEQEQMLDHPESLPGKVGAAIRRAARRRAAQKPQSAFYIEGDTRASEFDESKGVLAGGPGVSFIITRKSDEAAVEGWANNSSLIHYKCDQHANCALSYAGSPGVVYAKRIE